MAIEGPALSADERERVDAALAEARRWHYLSFAVLGVTALFTFSGEPSLRVPGFDFKVDRPDAGIALFVVVVSLTALAFRLVLHTLWLLRRHKRPATSWIVIGPDGYPSVVGVVYLLLPVVATAVATAHCQGGELWPTLMSLLIYGLAVVVSIAVEGTDLADGALRWALLPLGLGFVLALLSLMSRFKMAMTISATLCLLVAISMVVTTLLARRRKRATSEVQLERAPEP